MKSHKCCLFVQDRYRCSVKTEPDRGISEKNKVFKRGRCLAMNIRLAKVWRDGGSRLNIP